MHGAGDTDIEAAGVVEDLICSHNPQKELKSIFEKIETGRASEANITSLAQLLDKQPPMVPEAIRTLISLMKKGDMKIYGLVILTLNEVAEKDIGLVCDSIDAILGCMQSGKKNFNEDGMIDTLEILFKIYQKYPERMGIAVPELLACLENISTKVRRKAYLLLDLLAATQSESFSGHTKELIRVLNGLNVDERVYACR